MLCHVGIFSKCITIILHETSLLYHNKSSLPINYIAVAEGNLCKKDNSYIYTIILLKSVGVSKLQVAILARSSREMSQTDCID